MPILPIGDTGKQYYLISFDEHGKERPEREDSAMRPILAHSIHARRITRGERLRGVPVTRGPAWGTMVR